VAGQAVKNSVRFNPFSFVNSGSIGAGSGSCTTGFWNCSAFADPNPNPQLNVPYQFGDMPRNSADIRGFAFYDEDLNLSKTFALTERFHAEFRGEMFNAFNRHSFNKPDSGIHDTNFGQVSSTLLGPRNVQFVLKIRY